MASTDARPLPIKNTAYRLTFPIYKSDGTLITGATALDSEVSKDAGTFADCTNEATEIATSSGVYYLDITSTEMNADCVAVVVKTSSTGAVPPVFILYPQESGDVKVDVQSYNGAAGTFSGGRPEVNVSHWLGTAAATPTTAGVPEVDITHWNGTAVATPDTAGYPKVTIKSGTGTGEISLTSGAVKTQAGIRKNQALANFPFLMTDSTNHAPATGKTVTGTRSIDGAAFASGTIANMTEVSNGIYQCDLGAGDLNGETICFRFTATGCDDLFLTVVTEPA